MSSLAGAQPVATVRRWDRVEKVDKQIPCPNIVTTYNRHMGGVDLLDSLIGLYRCRIRSKKWYHKIFFHLCDLVAVQAWLLYKRVSKMTAMERGNVKLLMLRDFKFRVAHGLISEGKTLNKPEQSRKRGRRSMDESPSIPLKRKACSASPTDDIRRDQIGHFPMCMKKRQRCRSCSKLARVMCRKCGVTLCFTSGKDSFFFLSPVIA